MVCMPGPTQSVDGLPDELSVIAAPPTNASPLAMARLFELPMLTSLPSVTPDKVPPLATNCAPPVAVTVPPLIVPDTSHEPVAASNVNPPLSVPMRFTVPPVRLNTPKPACVKLPPRFTVPLVALMVPVLFQLLPKVSVEVSAVIVPLLPQVELLMFTVHPLVATSAPELVKVLLI